MSGTQCIAASACPLRGGVSASHGTRVSVSLTRASVARIVLATDNQEAQYYGAPPAESLPRKKDRKTIIQHHIFLLLVPLCACVQP